MAGRTASRRRVEDLALQDNHHAMAFTAMAFVGLRWYAEDSPNPGWGVEEESWTVFHDGAEWDDADEDNILIRITASSRELISALDSTPIKGWGPAQWGLARALVLRHADLLSALIHEEVIPSSEEMTAMIRQHTDRSKR